MTPWRIRDFHEDDLDAAVRLWDDPAAGSTTPVFGVSDLISAVRAGAPAVVAIVGEDLVLAATLFEDESVVFGVHVPAA